MSRHDTEAVTESGPRGAFPVDGAGLPNDHLQKLAGDFLVRISGAVADGTLSVHEARELHRRVQSMADDRG